MSELFCRRYDAGPYGRMSSGCFPELRDCDRMDSVGPIISAATAAAPRAGGRPVWVLSETRLRSAFLRGQLPERFHCYTFGEGMRALHALGEEADIVTAVPPLDRTLFVLAAVLHTGRYPRLAANLAHGDTTDHDDEPPAPPYSRAYRAETASWFRFFDSYRLNDRSDALLRRILDEEGNPVPSRERISELLELLPFYEEFLRERGAPDEPMRLEGIIRRFGGAARGELERALPGTIIIDQPTFLFPLERRALASIGRHCPLVVLTDSRIAAAAERRTDLPFERFEDLPPSCRALDSIAAFLSEHRRSVHSVVGLAPFRPERTMLAAALLDGASSGTAAGEGIAVLRAADQHAEVELAARFILAQWHAAGRRTPVHVVSPEIDRYKALLRSIFRRFGIPVVIPKGDLVRGSALGGYFLAILRYLEHPTLSALEALHTHPLAAPLRSSATDREDLLLLCDSLLAELPQPIESAAAIRSALESSERLDIPHAIELARAHGVPEQLTDPESFFRVCSAAAIVSRRNELVLQLRNSGGLDADGAIPVLLRTVAALRRWDSDLRAALEGKPGEEARALLRVARSSRRSLSDLREEGAFSGERGEQEAELRRFREIARVLRREVWATMRSLGEAPPLAIPDLAALLSEQLREVRAAGDPLEEELIEGSVVATELLDARALRGFTVIGLGFTMASFPLVPPDALFQPDLGAVSRRLVHRSLRGFEVFESNYLFEQLLVQSEQVLLLAPERDETDTAPPAELLVELGRRLEPERLERLPERLRAVAGGASRAQPVRAERARRLLAARMSNARTPFDGELRAEEALSRVAQLLEPARAPEGGAHVEYGVRELDVLFDCAHRFYFSRVLKLARREEDLDGRVTRATGIVVHAVLDRAAEQGLLRRSVLRNDWERTLGRVNEIAAEELARVGIDWEQDPFTRQARNEIIAGLDSAADGGRRGYLKAALLLQRDRMSSDPLNTEKRFGGTKDPFVLERDGRRVGLVGVVDRVDLVEEGDGSGAPGYAVWDYKTGAGTEGASIVDGAAFQVPLYAAALRRLMPPGARPVRGGEIVLKDPRRLELDNEHPTKGPIRDHLTLTRSGTRYANDPQIVEERIEQAVSGLFVLDERVRRGGFIQRLETSEDQCGYCEFRRICARHEDRLELKVGGAVTSWDELPEPVDIEQERVGRLFGTPLSLDLRDQRDRTLSREQERACDVSRSVALTAGAGSGKTHVLMTRVVRLILNGADIESVVAITFTNRAAHELRDRVEQAMARAAERGTFGGEPLSEIELARLADARTRLPYALIGTIHSLASRIIALDRELAGVGHYQRILGDPERAELIEAAVVKVLRRSSTEPELHRTIEELLTLGLGRRELLSKMKKLLGDRKAYRAVTDGLPNDSAQLEQLIATLERGYFERLAHRLEELRAFLLAWEGRASSWWDSCPQRTKISEERRAGFERVFADVRSILGGELAEGAPPASTNQDAERRIAPLATLAEFLRAHRYGVNQDKKTGTPNYWNDLRDYLDTRLSELNATRFNPEREREALRAAARLVNVAKAIGAEVDAEKRRLEVVDNDDLIEAAHRAIVGEPISGSERSGAAAEGSSAQLRRETVRARLGSRIRHILIDEFQDTDPVQLQILEALLDAAAALPLHGAAPPPETAPPTFFLVGDCQQSIYAFRGSDVTVFEAGTELVKRIGPRGIPCTLSDNYRAAPGVVEVVNELFSSLFALDFAPDGTPLVPSAIHATPMHSKRAAEDDRERVMVLTAGADDEEGGRKARGDLAEARRIARFVAALSERRNNAHFPLLFSTSSRPQIALLARSKRNLNLLGSALDEVGVPYRRTQRNGFYDRNEVQAVEVILKTLADPHDLIARAGALRTPFVGLSDEELLDLLPAERSEVLAAGLGVLDRLRRRAAVVPVSELLEELFDQCALPEQAAELGEPDIADALGGLLGLLREGERSGVLDGSPHAAYRWLVMQRDADRADGPPRSGAPELVELFTMHAAKGLEFPLVILPFLGSRRRGFSDRFAVGELSLPDGRKASALGLRIDDREDGFKRRGTHVERMILESDEQASAAEERRVFYVACTRAKDYLVLSGAERREPASREKARGSRSPADWISWFEASRSRALPRIVASD